MFVFLEASLPKDHEGDEAERYQSGQGGQLQPVMCVDRALEELGSFAELVAESKAMNQDWQIVLLACLSGRNGVPPSSDDAEKPLKMMMQTVETGGDLSRFMAFDREGTPIQFG
ncbi:MAG: ribonucleotide reductase subunit alpha [Pseudomonadales bacterium]